MKILLLSPLPPPAGGIATWTKEYCKYMAETDHSLFLINTAITGKRVAGHKKRLWDELMRTWKILGQLKKALRGDTYDCIHINTSCTPTGLLRDVACLLMAGGRPAILHCHCNVADQIGNSRVGKKLISLAIRKAACVLVLNEGSRQYLQTLGCMEAKIVPNFIDAEAVTPNDCIREKIEKILYVGHVRKEKGFFELLEAAASLPEMTFEVVGPVYEKREEVSIPSNVHLLGMKPKEEVPTFLLDADVFLFPSHSEGFSLALLEAMAAGLPVITTSVGANKDMVEDQGGILVPVGDAKAIVSAVERLQPQSLRSTMSEWNRLKVEGSYTAERVISQLLDILQECAM